MSRLDQCPVRPGDMLADKYRVERVLGVGGMGAVVAARHVVLDEVRAIKLLLARTERRSDAVERFVREARAVVRLRNEHVVRVHDVGTLPSGAPYMVMDYLEGRSLKSLLDRGQVPVSQAVDYVLQALEAVAEAHAAGLVHRDLKPSNLYVTTDADDRPCVKVLDFGISKLLRAHEATGDMTSTSDLLGSPFYMSPEQMRSTRNVDERADIWSIGIILYELLGGTVPFKGETITEVCLSVVGDEPVHLAQLRPNVPPGLAAVVMRCLEKDVDKRYQNVADLADDLSPFTPAERRISLQRIARALGRAPSPSAAAAAAHPRYSDADDETTVVVPQTPPAETDATLVYREEDGSTAARAPSPEAPSAIDTGSVPNVGASTGLPGVVAHPDRTAPMPAAADSAGSRAAVVPWLGDEAAPTGPAVGSVADAAATTGSSWQQEWPASPSVTAAEQRVGPKTAVVIGAAVAVVLTAVGLVLFFASRGDESAEASVASAPSTAASGAPPSASAAAGEPAPSAPSAPEGMVVVPAGEYWVGCDEAHAELCFDDEKPGHLVEVAAYALMRREVTVGEYDECVRAEACPPPTKEDCNAPTGNPKLPVACVPWSAADAYCRHRGWRLPTEQEWEVAARGKDRRSFPWGNEEPSCERAVVAGPERGGCDGAGPMVGGSKAADVSWAGVEDLGGNVREWTATDYQAYPGGAVEEGAAGKVNRGASWLMKPARANTSHTRGVDAEREARPDLGFRCAADR